MALLGQSPDLRPRFTLKTRASAPIPPEPPRREAGDSVRIDNKTREIVAESRGATIRLPDKASEIGPSVALSVRHVSSGSWTYSYVLANDLKATRAVSAIIFETPNPARITASLDAGWMTSMATLGGHIPSSIMVKKNADDSDLRLLPGQRIAIRLSSTDVPGIIPARILPVFDLEPKPGALRNGEFFNVASEWVREEMLRLDTRDRREVTLFVLGPKLASETDSVDAVKSELRGASGLPAFKALSQQLIAASQLMTVEQVLAALQGLGKSPDEAAFVAAMSSRLAALRSR